MVRLHRHPVWFRYRHQPDEGQDSPRQDEKYLVQLDLQEVKEDKLFRVREVGGGIADEHLLEDITQHRACYYYLKGYSDIGS